MKPLMKWIGGKTRLAPEIAERLTSGFTEYHEPFAGGAGLFCELHTGGDLSECVSVSLSDANEDLMRVYLAVRDDVEELVARLRYLHRKYHHPDRDSERLYYEQRDLWNAGQRDPWRFIFLKQTAFNGLWRISRSGKMNASWGKYKTASILDEDNVRAWSYALQRVSLSAASYETLDPGPDALVYVDPPYLGTFDGYTSEGFTHVDHARLLCKMAAWRDNGASVVYSNSTAVEPLLRVTWPDAVIHQLETTYVVNTQGSGRTRVRELLAM